MAFHSSFAGVPLLAEVIDASNGGSPNLAIHLLAVVIYSAVGMFVLGASFWILKKVIPFSVTKEIEQDQNIALGIIIGSVIIGMSIIIAAAIH